MCRRVDLRWRIQPDEIQRLRAVQLELLRHAVSLLKRRGTMVYSTCSLEPEENRQVVEQFLRERNEFKLENEREAFFDQKSNTIVIYNPRARDKGTCFRPRNGLKYYENLK